MKSTVFLSLSLLLLVSSNSCYASLEGAPIHPKDSGIARPSEEELHLAPKNRYMVTMSVPGDRSLKHGCTLSFDFDRKSGEIQNLSLLRSSGKANLDFDCICAVLGSAPFEANKKGFHKNIRYTFGGRDLAAKNDGIKKVNRDNRKEFLSQISNRSSDFFICNLIPISIKYRYPGIFTDEELCSSKNLRLIRKDFFARDNEPSFAKIVSNSRFRRFYDRWFDFITTHKKASKQEIEKFRDEVDKEFGDVFRSLSNSTSEQETT